MAERVGQRFGEYRLIRFLGKGSFAEVYLGEHVQDQLLTAVKVMQGQMTAEDLKEFIKEVSVTFRLHHPNIVEMLDFGIGPDDAPYLVMAYAPNGTLHQRYPKGTRLSLASIIGYATSIAAALQHAHEKRLIHRDVKPENVLLGPNNEVWLSDFGIAALARSSRSLDIERPSGTIYYMAPEQLQGRPRPASDQYALGIMVYEWLCGSGPFNGTAWEIMSQHLTTAPPPLREKVPTISADVEQVVLTTLAKDPKARFANVQAFATALEEASRGVVPEIPVIVHEPATKPLTVTGQGMPKAVGEPTKGPSVSPAYTTTLVDFPMFGFNAHHTRYNSQEHLISPANVARLVRAWSASTGDSISSSPAVVNGIVYVGSHDGKLHALEAATGQVRWTATTGDWISSSPTVSYGLVYVGSNDNKLYALEAATGQVRWTATTGDWISSSPTVANGQVYVGSWDRKLYAFDAIIGETLWTATTEERISSSPAVSNGLAYIGSEDGRLYAFDAGTGEMRWSAPTGERISSSPALADGIVYVGSYDGKLYAFDAITGEVLWVAVTGDQVWSSPAVADGVVYSGSNDKQLYAFEADSGRLRWSFAAGDAIYSSPMVANGVVYVGSHDSKLYALEAASGQKIWSASTGDWISSSPAVANGMVFVGSYDKKLYAFRLG